MRFFPLILALTGLFALLATTLPTDFNLAIPDPNSSNYAADLAAAISYARSHPTPQATSDKASSAKENKQCGVYSNIAGHFSFPTYQTEQYCNETEDFEEMDQFFNWYCGFCIVFDGRGCQGAIRWSGGPRGPGPHDANQVRGAKSYYCY